MGLPLPSERRQSLRYRARSMPGYLMIADSKEVINCFPIDVSADGLGVLSPEMIMPETELFLVVGDKEIPLEIAWVVLDWYWPEQEMTSENELESIYRYGLRLRDMQFNLKNIFASEGCLG